MAPERTSTNPVDAFVSGLIGAVFSGVVISDANGEERNTNSSIPASPATQQIRNIASIRRERNADNVPRPETESILIPRNPSSLPDAPSVQSRLPELADTPASVASATTLASALSLSGSLAGTPTRTDTNHSLSRLPALVPKMLWDVQQDLRNPDERQPAEEKLKIECDLCQDYFQASPWKCPNPTCEARFCDACVDKTHQPECHFCRESSLAQPFVTDSALADSLNQLSLRCRYKECLVVLPYSIIGQHEDMCPSARVRCMFWPYGCEWEGPKEATAEHLSSECRLAAVEDLVDRFRQVEQDKAEAKRELQWALSQLLLQSQRIDRQSQRIIRQQRQIERQGQRLKVLQKESEIVSMEYNMLLKQQKEEAHRQEDVGCFGPMDTDRTTRDG